MSKGTDLETWIQNSANELEEHGILRLKKIDPPSRIIGRGRATKIIYTANPWLDFAGTWTERGGRTIILEAKAVDRRLPICAKGGITEKQFENARAWAEAGAAVLFLWLYKGSLVAFDMTAVQVAEATDAKSLKIDDGFLLWMAITGGPSNQVLGQKHRIPIREALKHFYPAEQ